MRTRIVKKSVRGVSLIELMIALAIGALLVMGLVEVFSASRTAYQLSEGLSRVQENGRFALDYIQRDFRMAGHMGCVNDQSRFLPENAAGSRSSLASTFLTAADQNAETYAGSGSNLVPDSLRFDAPIQGYEYAGTNLGNTLQLQSAPVAGAAATGWVPNLPDELEKATKNRIAGSDIVVLRQFSPRGAQVTNFSPGDPTAQIVIANAANLREGDTDPRLFGIADCMSAGVFYATSFVGNTITVTRAGLNKSAMAGLEPFVAGQATVYVAETMAYYVGLNGQEVPALFRVRFKPEVGGAKMGTPVQEELVEGIESLQLRYGLDSRLAAAGRPTGNIGTSTQATAATEWRRVGLMQVGVVARSIDPAAAAPREDDATRMSALGVQIAPPATADGRFRTVYEGTVALRNRLFGH